METLFTSFFTMENIIALITLTSLEVVLGIDNIVFVVVVTNKLPRSRRESARKLGIGLAMITRILLLLTISLIMGLTAPWFELFGHAVSGRDIVLLAGGLFLLAKATMEIHEKLEEPGHERKMGNRAYSFAGAIMQIMLLDMVFSIDSVITAVGMAKHVGVMIVAIVLAVLIMLVFANAVSRFVNDHPTIQMLAFSFLLLVGILLVAEGLGKHIDRGYVYFAMGFSLAVEFLNLRMHKVRARKRAA